MTERNHHQHLRRPPDVEEALSSMLWTPYERTPTDSSSSDDDDVKLNNRLQKSSQANTSYESAATETFVPMMPSSYFDCDDFLLPATVATMTTTAIATTTAAAAVASFVPFSNIMLSSNSSQQQQQPFAATSNYHHKDYDPAAKSNYRISYPYYGPIPSLNKWWSSSSTSGAAGTMVEPPSYDSLYANKNSTTLRTSSSSSLRPVLKSLKATVTTLSNAAAAASKMEAEGLSTVGGVVVESGGRMVHSFTDNFIVENCPPSVPLLTSNAHSNNHNPHTRLLQEQQQQQTQTTTKRTCYDQLHFVNNVNSGGDNNIDNNISKGQVNDNFNDVTTKQLHQQVYIHQMNTKHKQNKEENNYSNNKCMQNVEHRQSCERQQQQLERQLYNSDDDDSNNNTENEETNVKQVNQPVSVALCAKRPISTRNSNSSSIVTTAQMNSPTMNITMRRDKATKTTFNNTNNNNNSSINENTTNARRTAALALKQQQQQQKTVISSSRAFKECGSLPLFVSTSSSSTVEKSNPAIITRSNLDATRARTNFVSHELTPNKCLAELERLRAEFRASESKRAAALSGIKMRVNIPATATVAVATMKIVPVTASVVSAATTTTSSVFLTSSGNNNKVNSNSCGVNNINGCNNDIVVSNNNNNDSVGVAIMTATTNVVTANPCQRQPSLTIQVNNNNNCNGNVVSSNNNNTQTMFPTHFDYFVNPTTIVNNNGISVVNCNYVQNEKSSGVVSVNSSSVSSSVPNVFNSSNKQASILNCVNNNINNKSKNNVANIATTSTTTIANESVNIINVNSHVDKLHCKPAAAAAITTSPQSPTIAINTTMTNSNLSSPSSESTSTSNSSNSSANSTPTASPSRTFTSTECQTDDISTVQLRTKSHNQLTATTQRPNSISAHPPNSYATPSSVLNTREQRRRERRERRHQQQQLQQLQHGPPPQMPPPHPHHGRRHSERRSLPVPPPPHSHLHSPHHALHHALAAAAASVPPNATMPAAMSAMLRPMLPDILHSHFPPPYSALPINGGPGGVPPLPPPPNGPPPPPPPLQAASVGPTLLTPVISTVPMPGATTIVGDGRFTIPLPIIRRSPSERSGKGCCGQWFAGPPLRALIAVVALGGVACALGGAALGATGLAGPPSSHFTAALLMIGVGVVLVTVSGAAWRMTAPGGPPCLGLGSSVDLGRCGRRPCSRGGGAPHGLLYPEFQHRPPPPSYQASMQEYRLRLLLLDRDRQNGVVRGNSPPPTYRSHAGSLLRAPLTTTIRGIGNSNGGAGGSSSIGGSEYSLPPSYRSRNATPATICSERNIETAPSGRLLANEDIPEPLSAEQLPEYSSLQHLRQLSNLSSSSSSLQQTPKATETTTTTIATATTTAAGTVTTTRGTGGANQLRTSAIVEIETTNNGNASVANDKLPASRFKEKFSSTSICNGSTKGKDLVTIVTISQNHCDMLSANNLENEETRQQQQSNEQMEILAHL